MAKKNGLETLLEIRRMGKMMPINMVSMESVRSHITQAIRADANSYVLKPFYPTAVAEKTRVVMTQVARDKSRAPRPTSQSA